MGTMALSSQGCGNENRGMTYIDEDQVIPFVDDPRVREDAAEVAPRDSEIDFDDETEGDQLPLDTLEAEEVGALLDDPETMDLD